MKHLLTLGMVLAAMTVHAHPSTNKDTAEINQSDPLASECCRMTYDEIREQLLEGAITIEEAQELWLEHKKNE